MSEQTREIRLPALSATMEEAVLLAWKVEPGQTVREGEPIAEVSTDKVDMDLESPFAGTIAALLAEPGTAVPLGAVLATIVTEAEDFLGGLVLDDEPTPESTPKPTESETTPGPGTVDPDSGPITAPTSGTITAAVPPARKMARDLGIDLREVTPTGQRGQITPDDVRRHAESRSRTPERPASPAPAATTDQPAPRLDDARALQIRRATADIMNRTAVIPQFTLWKTLILDRPVGRRQGRSWTTEFVRALAGAVRAHPEINATWDDEGKRPVPLETVAVGLAVDRPGIGLVVASLSDPDLSAADDADQAVRALVDRARLGKLRPADLSQPSITISNLGGFGIDRFQALLFPPQASILSVGSIAMKPVVTADGGLKPALVCEVGLTVDHRVVDGADGARLLQTFAEILETG